MIARSLLLVGPRRLAWVEAELPPPGPGEVVVETLAGAVSVGTELPLYRGDHRGSRPIGYPTMTGYESLARVVACGPGVRGLAAGARIVATYGHRTHAVLSAERAIPVPDDVSTGAALLAILSCDTAKGMARLAPDPGEPVLITGAGTIGLLAAHNLAARGHPVDVVEPIAARRALALHFGARAAVAPHQTLPAASYTAAIERSGRNVAFRLLQQAMSAGGRICVLSDGNLEPLELDPAFHERELLVVASSDGVDYYGHAVWFYEHARGSRVPFERLYEWRIPAAELEPAFARLAATDVPPIKVEVRYGREGEAEFPG